MQISLIFLLAVGSILMACTDQVDPPADGILIVSTRTSGGDPDPDGVQLTIDGAASIALEPNNIAKVVIAAGRHALGLQGVARQCSTDPGPTLDVDIVPPSETRVAFELNCPAVGARITMTTTGVDIDDDGYRVAVDGIDRAPIPSNAVAFIRTDSGSRTITLTGLASNCAITGSSSQTMTIVANHVTPVEFAAACTATTGLIAVSITASGADVEGKYQVMVDGLPQLTFSTGPGSDGIYLPAGDHVLDLVPPFNCSVTTGPQTVTVNAGQVTRDTVAVAFSVLCVENVGTLRIRDATRGIVPGAPYAVTICQFCDWDIGELLGNLAPNGTLVVDVRGSQGPSEFVELENVPPTCFVRRNEIPVTILLGDTVDVEFSVRCPS